MTKIHQVFLTFRGRVEYITKGGFGTVYTGTQGAFGGCTELGEVLGYRY